MVGSSTWEKYSTRYWSARSLRQIRLRYWSTVLNRPSSSPVSQTSLSRLVQAPL